MPAPVLAAYASPSPNRSFLEALIPPGGRAICYPALLSWVPLGSYFLPVRLFRIPDSGGPRCTSESFLEVLDTAWQKGHLLSSIAPLGSIRVLFLLVINSSESQTAVAHGVLQSPSWKC